MKRVILCDFDGTITNADVTDTLCDLHIPQHKPELRRQSDRWKAGEISAVEWEEIAYGLLDLRREQIDAVLPTIEVCPGLKPLLQTAEGRGWEFHILSSGFDYYITDVLRRQGLSLPFTANRITFTPEGRPVLGFLGNDDPACTRYKQPCIGCKPVVWDDWKRRGYRIAFIGDGVSDLCVAEHMRERADPEDLLFAKGSLQRHCRERSIAHLPFDHLGQVAERLLVEWAGSCESGDES